MPRPSRSRGKHAILALSCPDWHPTHWSSIPFNFESAHWFQRAVHLHEAVRIIRQHNCSALPSVNGGTFPGLWLILVTNARAAGRYHSRLDYRSATHRRLKLVSHAIAKATAEGNHELVESLKREGGVA